MKRSTWRIAITGLLVSVLTSGCSLFKESNYGLGAQAERAAMMQAANKDDPPDTPGMYLSLIDRMQQQGLFYASLAHIDAYEKQYGASPDTHLLRADALRATSQLDASEQFYTQLLNTPLAARGYRGIGLIAGTRGDFARAAKMLDQATLLAPTDASTLSDLAYARMRTGDLAAARVPLMKAAELDQKNARIISNVALFLVASGHQDDAQGLMDQQHMAPQVRSDILNDAARVVAAQRTRQLAAVPLSVPAGAGRVRPGGQPIASNDGFDLAAPLLQRFSQK
ncbi:MULTISPECIES: tetratricopeptide repeat protein [Burkholderia]|uniref:Pilus assembly protein n=1 Tax=Burkholderia gladioli TaxID=28095 RepID=A0A2A7S4P9_BURGA|nr:MULTISPECIES: pilus assembly protein [Burkholderia]MBU9166134.1 pilus assembly protein [Burkholderia gladioli]MBU9195495.1 pilus assembly protein [Burkholderia gladioli]MBU9385016.1 pilus assembly protein [Burkholderia gladioli]MBU9422542.1 pilus assembly protein [Burkholderia gladioli]MDC6127026.1 pilus assembly protein [Burkholderia gladioli]